MITQQQPHGLKACIFFISLTLLTGCTKSLLYATAGVTERFTEREMIPYVMTTDDLNMSCAMAESMTPVLMAMKRFNADLEKTVIMTMISASLCSQAKALDMELNYQRALYNRNTTDAQDARIAIKRFYEEAAKRQYASYQRLVKFYGEPGGKHCPTDLDREIEQLYYLVGLISGLQAVYSDTQAALGQVPRDIAAKVERAANCLDNHKWFGIPLAIRASIWTLLPNTAPVGEDSWARLTEASKIGEQQHIRLAHVFQALAAYSTGNTKAVRQVIKQHANAVDSAPANPDYRMLDTMATAQIQSLSDLLWTEATGHRTPNNKLGEFWDEQADVSDTINIDDLL